MCSSEADALVARVDRPDRSRVAKAALLAEAEAELTLANVYIPFGSPLRFSLVRGDVDGLRGQPVGVPSLAAARCHTQIRHERSRRWTSRSDRARCGPDLPVGRDPAAVRQRIEAMERLLERSLTVPGINCRSGSTRSPVWSRWSAT